MDKNKYNWYAFKGFLNFNGLYNDKKINIVNKIDVQDDLLLADYHISFLNIIDKIFELKDKRILEIGGSNFPRDVLINKLKVKSWVSVDTPWWKKDDCPKHFDEIKQGNFSKDKLDEMLVDNDYLLYKGFTDNITPDFYGNFDICLSLCCLEHIQNVKYAFDVIYSCLDEGGVFYSEFAPLWSGPYGSHFWIRPENLTFNNPQFIPPFTHLLNTRREIYEMLVKNCKKSNKPYELEKWAKQISGDDSFINKYFYEDYLVFIEESKFKKKFMCPVNSIEIDGETFKKLKERYPRYNMFENKARIVLIK